MLIRSSRIQVNRYSDRDAAGAAVVAVAVESIILVDLYRLLWSAWNSAWAAIPFEFEWSTTPPSLTRFG
jgi:hypothetical protein